MAETFLVLGQQNPGAATLTPLYTADAPTAVSGIVVANRSATATAFRISVAVAGAADSNEQYVAYDVPIAGNDVVALNDLKITLANTDVIRVYATLATLSFSAFGVKNPT